MMRLIIAKLTAKKPLWLASVCLLVWQVPPLLAHGQELAAPDYANVPMTDLMVNLPDADIDTFATEFLRQSATQQPIQTFSLPKPVVRGPSNLDFNEVVLGRSEWLSEINAQVDSALANNNWPLAEVKLAQVLAEYPDAHDSRLRLASLLYGRGALGQTRAVLQQGLELAPKQADLRLTLARLLAEQQRFAAALQQLSEANPVLAENLDYYSLKAEVARRSGECEQSIATYRQLLAHSRVGSWWLGLGLCQRELGEEYQTAFMQAQASADLGLASQRFVEQQLEQLQQQEQNVKAQTY
ncbi:MAG: tetratricopeptide repeat protein [Oceanisphaera sp.]|uniref:tetratricopeptide repeat protein n=1 Tax=Oceanisphaera sp. TaxID=1929979 RepID=UPI003C70D2C7